MIYHPTIFEINTRVWLRRFDRKGRKATLADVPAAYWDYLAEQGVDHVWLMGVWETVAEAVPFFCFEEGLVRSYQASLPDWKPGDVIGSPYAIEDYRISERVGTTEDLDRTRQAINERGMKLILDFIPNHFHAHSSLVKEKPEVFLEVSPAYREEDPRNYFLYNGRVFAHGKDPYFPGWRDTVQVNYFHPEARRFMQERLLSLTDFCDGVRCDMAILMLNDVLQSTWGNIAAARGWPLPGEEFWETAIEAVKDRNKDFLLIAEAYWDREWYLQQIGFDYTYDKKLTDRLKTGPVTWIRDHLHADLSYQERSVRFLENHDEERSLEALGEARTQAAAVIVSTLPGMRFYHHGQWEGRRVHLPVQLGREPEERRCQCAIGPVIPLPAVIGNGSIGQLARPADRKKAVIEPLCRCLFTFYHQLLRITRDDVFKKGEWQLLALDPIGEETHHNLLAWQWQYEEEHRLVIVNYSGQPSAGRLPFAPDFHGHSVELTDLFNGQFYRLSEKTVQEVGLVVKLPPFKSHIFAFR